MSVELLDSLLGYLRRETDADRREAQLLAVIDKLVADFHRMQLDRDAMGHALDICRISLDQRTEELHAAIATLEQLEADMAVHQSPPIIYRPSPITCVALRFYPALFGQSKSKLITLKIDESGLRWSSKMDNWKSPDALSSQSLKVALQGVASPRFSVGRYPLHHFVSLQSKDGQWLVFYFDSENIVYQVIEYCKSVLLK